MVRLTIIFPVLNNVAGLERAVDSALHARYKGVELIVIDGGSTDGTLEVIKSYKDEIAYWESGLDSGIADAFNRGIERATGSIIGILNSDDVLEPGALKSLFETVDSNPSAEVYYGSLRYYNPEKDYSYIRKPDITQMKRRMSIFHPAMFVQKTCYEAVGLYDCNHAHAMDSEWCHRAMVSGAVFCEVPAVLATMSLGGVSDLEYKKSLSQYRDSTVKHGIASSIDANFYYWIHLLQKIVMGFPLMYQIKRLRDRLFSSRVK